MTERGRQRVVVTGIGAVTPIGTGRRGLWAGVKRGRSAVGPVTRFDAAPFRSRLAAEIGDFDPLAHLDSRQARRLDRYAQLALVTARLAVDDARLHVPEGRPRNRAGVYLGSALGGVAYAEEQHTAFLARGVRAVSPTLALAVFGGASATNVAIDLGWRGPNLTNANSCAAGAVAIGEAFRLIRAGGTNVMLAGGVEAPLAPLTFGAFALIKAMSMRNDCPGQASRPFDAARDGFVMGEGACIVVLESLAHALRRGADVLGEVVGYALTNDAHHMTAPRPDGRQAARTIRLALADAGLKAHRIGYINAHGSSTVLGDAAEAQAIRTGFGRYLTPQVLVSATKGLYGHPLGASGAIEAALTVEALRTGWLPPTTNLEQPDPQCALPLVPAGGLDRPTDYALCNTFGFGGINACLVLACPGARDVDDI